MRITETPDPMVGQGRLEGREEFSKQTVEEYALNKASFKRFPLRHYRQLEFSFDGVGELLGRLQIPTHITGLVFGGYTGQFANALRELGMTVIFADLEFGIPGNLLELLQGARFTFVQARRFPRHDVSKANGLRPWVKASSCTNAPSTWTNDQHLDHLYNGKRFIETIPTRRNSRRLVYRPS